MVVCGEIEDSFVGDHQLWSFARHAEPASRVATVKIAGTGTEVESLDEGAFLEPHDVEDALGVDGDLAGAAAAWQAHLGRSIVADDAGVQVAVAVDLRAAEQADLDTPALQIEAKQIGH